MVIVYGIMGSIQPVLGYALPLLCGVRGTGLLGNSGAVVISRGYYYVLGMVSVLLGVLW